MAVSKKALLLGDYASAPYHPLDAVQEELRAILGGSFEVDVTDNYDRLVGLSLREYNLVISYADRWEGSLSSDQAAGLIAYVAQGGGLLVLHNGISLQNRHELRQLIGAKFTGHPDYQRLTFQIAAESHEMMAVAEPFEMDEEPYQFEFDSFLETELLMTYELNGQTYPAAWAHEYGLGRVVYLMPGHHLQSFKHAGYQKLIVGGAIWAAVKLFQ